MAQNKKILDLKENAWPVSYESLDATRKKNSIRSIFRKSRSEALKRITPQWWEWHAPWRHHGRISWSKSTKFNTPQYFVLFQPFHDVTRKVFQTRQNARAKERPSWHQASEKVLSLSTRLNCWYPRMLNHMLNIGHRSRLVFSRSYSLLYFINRCPENGFSNTFSPSTELGNHPSAAEKALLQRDSMQWVCVRA